MWRWKTLLTQKPLHPLQHGVPLKLLADKFAHTRFDPAGFTGNPEVPRATSLMDYIFRWLASKFLSAERQEAVGVQASETSLKPHSGPVMPVAAPAADDPCRVPDAPRAASHAASAPRRGRSSSSRLDRSSQSPAISTTRTPASLRRTASRGGVCSWEFTSQISSRQNDQRRRRLVDKGGCVHPSRLPFA